VIPLLDVVADRLRLPSSLKEQAALIYRKALQRGVILGRSVNLVLAASVYAACRAGGLQRQLGEVASALHVSEKRLRRCYRVLLRELDMDVPVSDPAGWASRLSNLLHLSDSTCNRAISIIQDAKQKGLVVGRRPHAVAAAAVYLASILEKEPVTQRMISQKLNVTEVTIRDIYKDFRRALSISIEEADE